MTDTHGEWRVVPGLPASELQVSSLGYYRVQLSKAKDGRLSTPSRGNPKKHGYVGVVHRGKHHYLHRLVCTAFHGPASPGQTCDHVDQNRQNNAALNLRWATKQQQRSNQSEIRKKSRTSKVVFARHAEWPDTTPWRRFESGLDAFKTWKINNVAHTIEKKRGRVGNWNLKRDICDDDLPEERWVSHCERLRVSTLGRAQTKDTRGVGWSAKFVPAPLDDRPYATVLRSTAFHRCVFMAFGGKLNDWETVDHINGDTSDNRLCNLRAATASMQAANKPSASGNRNTSGIWARPKNGGCELFESQLQAAKLLSTRTGLRFHVGSISHVLNGTRTDHNGYAFYYA